jgi:hypothetical protein
MHLKINCLFLLSKKENSHCFLFSFVVYGSIFVIFLLINEKKNTNLNAKDLFKKFNTIYQKYFFKIKDIQLSKTARY